MAWIKVIDETQASGLLKEIYEELERKRGKVANIMKVHSLNPHAMKRHMELYITLMFGKSGLTRDERELIAVTVSALNNCEYCLKHHGHALNNYWKDEKRIEKLLQGFRSVDLPEKTLKMLEYSAKLTRTPDKVNRSDIEELRRSGFRDEDILNINLITSYFNFVNRIALGLGVHFTPEEVKGYKT
ncbi:MAG: peroxidase-related enzyme [Candidatus Bathyarchaeia archaeon]